jgi:hypothetical protein
VPTSDEKLRYTSAGRLPQAAEVQAAVDQAWRRFRSHRDGVPSTVYPALASAS